MDACSGAQAKPNGTAMPFLIDVLANDKKVKSLKINMFHVFRGKMERMGPAAGLR